MEEVENVIRASQKAEERRKERDAPVHGLKHEIEEQRYSDVEHVRDEAGGFMDNRPAPADEDLAGYCRQKIE
jgi:hypothetical protein